jgi:hypothetical protein
MGDRNESRMIELQRTSVIDDDMSYRLIDALV